MISKENVTLKKMTDKPQPWLLVNAKEGQVYKEQVLHTHAARKT